MSKLISLLDLIFPSSTEISELAINTLIFLDWSPILHVVSLFYHLMDMVLIIYRFMYHAVQVI